MSSKVCSAFLSPETTVAIVAESIVEHGSKLSRGKLFKDSFERAESLTNKDLDDNAKKAIRSEVDKQLNEVGTRSATEQVIQVKSYQDIDTDTELVIGRQIKTVDSRRLSFVEELQLCYEVLRLHLKKIAEVEDEEKLEKMSRRLRRYKNAVYGRLSNAAEILGLTEPGEREKVDRIRAKMDEKFGNTPKSAEIITAECRAAGYQVA